MFLGDIIAGKHELSVAGFTQTLERNEVVDFLPVIDNGFRGVIVPRPTGSEITVQNYTKEFRPVGWIAILLAFVILWLFISLLLFMDQKQSRPLESLFVSSYIVLRAMVGKVGKTECHCETLLRQLDTYFRVHQDFQ